MNYIKFCYKQVLDYLEDLSRLGIRMGLDNMRKLMELLGDPHKHFKSVHIGGTVGKGSTAHLLASILMREGLKCGLFTSPHIYDVRERFVINGKIIGKRELISLVRYIRDKLNELDDFHPTQFEVHTALAFLWFAQQGCDMAVVEVGLGGRLDATNIISPLLTIITDIGLDHTDLLGSTIEEIAMEKAGIIKEGVPLLTSASGKALEVLKRQCEVKFAPIYPLMEKIFYEGKEELTIYSPWGEVKGIRYKLKGTHQRKNIALAVSAGLFLGCSEKAIREGVLKTKIKGRFEVLRRNPTVILDGAHNPPAMKALNETLEQYLPSRNLILVIGMLKDKPIEESMKEIVPNAKLVIVTPPPSERSPTLEELEEAAKRFNPNVIAMERNDEAVKLALSLAEKKDIVLITGSFYLLGALPMIRRILVSRSWR